MYIIFYGALVQWANCESCGSLTRKCWVEVRPIEKTSSILKGLARQVMPWGTKMSISLYHLGSWTNRPVALSFFFPQKALVFWLISLKSIYLHIVMPADIVNVNSTMCTDECAHIHTAYGSLSTQCTLVLLASFTVYMYSLCVLLILTNTSILDIRCSAQLTARQNKRGGVLYVCLCYCHWITQIRGGD